MILMAKVLQEKMSKAPFIDDNDDSNNSSSDCHDSVDGNSTQAHEDTCSNYNEDICSICRYQ